MFPGGGGGAGEEIYNTQLIMCAVKQRSGFSSFQGFIPALNVQSMHREGQLAPKPCTSAVIVGQKTQRSKSRSRGRLAISL